MKRFVLLPLILLIFLSLPCGICLADVVADSDPQTGDLNKGGAPEIQFNEIVHNFGEVYQQETLKHTFTFRNIGPGTLRIKKVKAG